jgi:hypothetical protein
MYLVSGSYLASLASLQVSGSTCSKNNTKKGARKSYCISKNVENSALYDIKCCVYLKHNKTKQTN